MVSVSGTERGHDTRPGYRIRYALAFPRNWRARARCFYWFVIRRWETEMCQQCGRRVAPHTGSWWHADEALWRQVNGRSEGVLCPPCFTEACDRSGIHVYWQPVPDVSR